MIKAICLNKIRDKHRIIKGYYLVDTNSNYLKVEATELKRNIASGLVDVVNLQLDGRGRLIDKSVDINSGTSDLISLKIKYSYEKAVDYIIKTKAFEYNTESDSYIGSFSKEEQNYIRSLRKTYDSIHGAGSFDNAIVDYAVEQSNYNGVYYAEFDQADEFVISTSKEKVVHWCKCVRYDLQAAGWDIKTMRDLFKATINIESAFQ